MKQINMSSETVQCNDTDVVRQSLVMSIMVSFCAVLFPTRCLG